MMQSHEFPSELKTSDLRPDTWSTYNIYTSTKPSNSVIFDGCNEAMLNAPVGGTGQSTTGLVNNPIYLYGRFSIKINPSNCLNTTIIYDGNKTIFSYIPNGEDHGITFWIDGNFFDIASINKNEPISISNLASFMGPYAQHIEFDVCYMAGTLIETPKGQVAIEALQIGDDITIFENDIGQVRTIRAIGCGQANVKPGLPDDLAGWPVRVCRGALADNLPFKDMLITAEHCLYLKGCFVPVRMLVNGQSIYYDKTITSFNYYHIETDPHSVIKADGVLSETLLDEGHERRLYNPIQSLPQRLATDWSHAAAPLNTARDFVEPLFREFHERAAMLGMTGQEAPLQVMFDHGLYLITDRGAHLEGQIDARGVMHFPLPHQVKSVHLMSHASRPCDALGPYMDDRRLLGILVGAVTIEEGGVSTPVRTHQEAGSMPGWQDESAGNMRWTKGNAFLPLPERRHEGVSRLSIEVLAGGPYVVVTSLPSLVRHSA
ncbi:Hint domain-containing protein [Asaia lannensis]|uniref:Hint domain-containing protein n=1 Tax=Asaia lannensis NBRC 102526 TaxID=1307926 RepID=A0ABT1CDA9_9PROT|nr:Hint domain-containing protein [Asaia lannensis]MCO6158766.1 Hint domain-containing protein [Asaia lannensis NBRC 102526]